MTSTPSHKRRFRETHSSALTSTLFGEQGGHSSAIDPLLRFAYVQTTGFAPSHDDLCLDTLRCATSQAICPPSFVGPNFQAIHDDLCLDTPLCATPPEPFFSGLAQQHCGPLHPLSVHPPFPRQPLPLHPTLAGNTMPSRSFSIRRPPEASLSGFPSPPGLQASHPLNLVEAGGSSSDGADDDSTSILSACSVGDNCCQGEECRDDATACNDQTCLQIPQDFTREMTNAAEALTSFMPTPAMPDQQLFSMYTGQHSQGRLQIPHRSWRSSYC